MNWMELYFKMQVILGIIGIAIIVIYFLYVVITVIVESIKYKYKKESRGIDMKKIINNIFWIIISIILLTSVILSIRNNLKEKEYIEQLEQSLTEQIQEVEVYRGILEEYQTEGIINE